MNPIRRLMQAWRRTRGTVVFSRRRHDPKTEAVELVTYRATPIPDSESYEVHIRVASYFGESETVERWPRAKLERVRTQTVELSAAGC